MEATLEQNSEKDKALVVKYNALIEARYRLSVRQQRVILTLISMIRREDTDFQRYVLKIPEIYFLLGLKRESVGVKRQTLKRTLKGLQKNILEIVTQTEGREILDTPAWIETPRYDWERDQVSLRISESLKPYLLQIKDHFTSYRLEEAVRFRKEYSFRFFEFCKNHEPRSDYKSSVLNGRYVKKVGYSIEELRRILGIPPKRYPRIYDFKQYVILPAQKEIREKTDTDFDFQMFKTGRSYTHIELIIKGREIPGLEAPAEDEKDNFEGNDFKTALIEFGLSEIAANKLMEERDAGELGEALKVCREYRESLKKNGEKIRMPEKILLKAIEEGWKSQKTLRKEEWEREERKIKEKLEAREVKKRLEEEARKRKAEKIRKELEELEAKEEEEARELEEAGKVYRENPDKLGHIISKLPAKDLESLEPENLESLKDRIEKQIIPTAAEFDEAIFRAVEAMLSEIELQETRKAREKGLAQMRLALNLNPDA